MASSGIIDVIVLCQYRFCKYKFVLVKNNTAQTLYLAGASSTIINPEALATTHSFAQGNPRLIDNMMDALTIGSQQDKKLIRVTVNNQGLY